MHQPSILIHPLPTQLVCILTVLGAVKGQTPTERCCRRRIPFWEHFADGRPSCHAERNNRPLLSLLGSHVLLRDVAIHGCIKMLGIKFLTLVFIPCIFSTKTCFYGTAKFFLFVFFCGYTSIVLYCTTFFIWLCHLQCSWPFRCNV